MRFQDIADYLEDSLGLSQQAAQTDADVIVFAGLHFMAETAIILNPNKLVLLPDLAAGCSLADSCLPEPFGSGLHEQGNCKSRNLYRKGVLVSDRSAS